MSSEWLTRADAIDTSIRHFVDGRYYPSSNGDRLAKYSPRNGRILYEFGAGEACDADRAVGSARRAYDDGRWRRQSVSQRKQVLLRLASLMEANLGELALLECMDTGKPIADTLSRDVPLAVAILRFSAEAADKLYGNVYLSDETSLSYQLHRPVGVVAGIVGWNFPLVLAAAKIGPALVTGNSLVLKPSELTSLSTARVAALAVEAGLPDGVLNVVHGAGTTVGAALAHHNQVEMLTFTGSSATGGRLMVAAGQSNMKRLLLECGGKSPNIVFSDCENLDCVADAVTARAFWNQGQVCTASSRLLVHEDIKELLLEKICERAARLVPGDPLLVGTTHGALISREHLQKVAHYVDKGKMEGAKTVFQTAVVPPCDGGYYASPVVFGDVQSRHSIAREEIFGPVLSVLTFRNDAEAIAVANDTIYGLSAIAWTRDPGRVQRVVRGIHAGWIVVNSTSRPAGGPASGVLPVAAHKQSGLGVEGGIAGLESYLSSSTIQWFL
jgi:acyl-CoA reductase-like NAD-dependent aldehyde dehydrogenase